jgi:tetratricopeptide (TPR) repeat protein
MRKFLTILFLLLSVSAFAQVDKKDVRRGNRQFAKAKYGDADISYRKGLNADSTSVVASYDLGNNLYRQGNYAEAGKFYQQALRHIPETRSMKKRNAQGFDTFFNLGDAALQQKQYRAAMEAFVQALVIDPDNLEAKENYVYARKMLESNPDGGGDQNQDQDQNQNQDQNQDQNQQDRNQDRQNQDQNQDQDKQDQEQQQKPYNGSEISPQQAQQMLQAIQAKEKETQDKVNREKAAVLKSRQKEKNW